MPPIDNNTMVIKHPFTWSSDHLTITIDAPAKQYKSQTKGNKVIGKHSRRSK